MALYQITLVVTAEQEEGIVKLFRQRSWIYKKIGSRVMPPDHVSPQLAFLNSLASAVSEGTLSALDQSTVTDLTSFDEQACGPMSREPYTAALQTHTNTCPGIAGAYVAFKHDKYDMKYAAAEPQPVNLNFKDSLDALSINSSVGNVNTVVNGARPNNNTELLNSTNILTDNQVGNVNSFETAQQQSKAAVSKPVCHSKKGVHFEDEADTAYEEMEADYEEMEVRVERVNDATTKTTNSMECVTEPDESDNETITDDSCSDKLHVQDVGMVTSEGKRAAVEARQRKKRVYVRTKLGTKPKKTQWNPKNRKLVSRSEPEKYREMYGIHCKDCKHTFIFRKVYEKHLENDKCRHECEYCGKVYLYGKTSQYKMHMKYHNKVRDLKCELCGKTYIDPRNLEEHMRKHRNDKPYMCDKCGQKFLGHRYLYAHKKNHHSMPQTFQCPNCPKTFKGKSGLQYHSLHFHEQKSNYCPFICDICGKEVSTKASLMNHQLIHLQLPKNFKCDECGAAFTRLHGLRQHKKRHAKQYTCYCSWCEKGFYSRQSLNGHENMHSGAKPYECSMCNYACAVKENLKKHMKTHMK